MGQCLSKQIRCFMRTKRGSTSAIFRKKAAVLLDRYIARQIYFLAGRYIGFYLPVRGECSLELLLWRALCMHKHCYLPICSALGFSKLRFVPYAMHDALTRNPYGILEPACRTKNSISPGLLDSVFVPLVAFDQQKNRLGSGKGYYDRTFAYKKHHSTAGPLLIGVAYAFQEVGKLTRAAWDIPMDKIIVVAPDAGDRTCCL